MTAYGRAGDAPPQLTDGWVLAASDAAATREVISVVDLELGDLLGTWARRAQLRLGARRFGCAPESGRTGHPAADQAELDAVRDLMRRTGALSRIEERIIQQTSSARAALADAPLSADGHAALDALAVAVRSGDRLGQGA